MATRAALGQFLRARRDLLSPAQAGMEAFPGSRRVPGLRREELAVLAGLSPDYYSRVEQGRQAHVSREVLDALARALRLTDVEREHLHALAAPPRPSRAVERRADPGLLRLMVALDHRPVLLLGQRGDVLARNALLTAVLGRPLNPGSSFPRYLFLDPLARSRIVNWATFAQASVGALRFEVGRRPHDRRLSALVAELRLADEDVARWWDDHGVRDYTSVAKQIRHPQAGDLLFDLEIVGAPHEPDQRLIVYTADPDSPTERMLPLLRGWADGQSDQENHIPPSTTIDWPVT